MSLLKYLFLTEPERTKIQRREREEKRRAQEVRVVIVREPERRR